MHVDPRSPATVLARAPGYVYKRVRRWLVARRTERFFNRRPDHRALAAEEASSVVVDADRILFLCWGNICRSPMAERYAARRVAAADADLDVSSAGFVEREGRSSPDTAVAVASEFGVDLADHGSAHVTREMVDGSDLVFLMDVDNYRRFRGRFPDAVEKAFLLRAVREEGGVEIPDPVHGDRDTFREVYGDVAAAVDRALARAGVVEA